MGVSSTSSAGGDNRRPSSSVVEDDGSHAPLRSGAGAPPQNRRGSQFGGFLPSFGGGQAAENRRGSAMSRSPASASASPSGGASPVERQGSIKKILVSAATELQGKVQAPQFDASDLAMAEGSWLLLCRPRISVSAGGERTGPATQCWKPCFWSPSITL
jgi:hypothetical protein